MVFVFRLGEPVHSALHFFQRGSGMKTDANATRIVNERRIVFSITLLLFFCQMILPPLINLSQRSIQI